MGRPGPPGRVPKVDLDVAAVDGGAVLGDGVVRGLAVGELDVAEALEIARLAVRGEADARDGAAVPEGRAHLVLVHAPRQIADEARGAARRLPPPAHTFALVVWLIQGRQFKN